MPCRNAFDPYYDPKSVPDKPNWNIVHAEFHQKFDSLVGLNDLRGFSWPGGVLEAMQTLRQGRLGASNVTKKDWSFIMSSAEVKIESEALAEVPVEQDRPHEDGNETT